MIFFLILLLVALPFLALAGVAVFYLVLGIRLRIEGRKESNQLKLRSGKVTMLNSVAALLLIMAVGAATEKEAVRIGGGTNHRFGLYDMIMLKDNHIDYCGGIEEAINRAFDYVQQYQPQLKIEVETRSVEDVKKVMQAGKGKVFRLMLDNFRPEQIREALQIIGEEFETEASGGINLDNIESYAATGVDYVSVGAVIHQAKSLDLSLKAVITK